MFYTIYGEITVLSSRAQRQGSWSSHASGGEGKLPETRGRGRERALNRKHPVLPGVEGIVGGSGGNYHMWESWIDSDCSEQFAHCRGEDGWHCGWRNRKCTAKSQEEFGMFQNLLVVRVAASGGWTENEGEWGLSRRTGLTVVPRPGCLPPSIRGHF